MRKTLVLLLIVLSGAAPTLAGLKLTATPNQASYNGSTTGTLALHVALDGMATGSIQFVTGPALSASPITLSFVAQAGASGPLPVITGTSVNAFGGWNPVVALTTNTFTAFNFTPRNLPPGVLVGQVNFSISSGSTFGMFDLVASAFALDGVDMPSQVLGKIIVAPTMTCLASQGANIVLKDDTVLVPRTFEVCDTIEVGPNYQVAGPAGNLTLRAGIAVILTGGASVGVDGQLTVEIDSSLLP